MTTRTVAWQRLESVAVALVVLAIALVSYPDHWWLLLALFLVFDLSALGYLAGPRGGAVIYNLGHSYAVPAVLGAIAVVMPDDAADRDAWVWVGILALSWAFHIAVDRALGYGLKEPDAFTHTHLGWIGKDRGKGTPEA